MLKDSPDILLFLLLVAGLLATGALLRSSLRANPLRDRLANGAADLPRPAASARGRSRRARLHRALEWIAGLGVHLAGTQRDRLNTERMLAQAGWRNPAAVGLLMAIKYASGVSLCALSLWLFVDAGQRVGLTGMAVGLVAFFMGALLPELVVKARGARRLEQLARSMPDALDLMVICAEAGLPFPRILGTVSRELALSAPIMADELAYTSAELQLLPDRATALRNLAERTRVRSIESMVGSLVQAERYGTPLAQALRTIAEESRNRFVLELEEKAGKLPAQLTLPLMILILPPVVAVVGAPALMRVIEALTR